MKLIILLISMPVLLLAQQNVSNIQNFSFAVIAPYSIRREKPFNVIVNGFNVNTTKKFTLKIFGETETGIVVKIQRTAEISKQKDRSAVQFETSKILPGNYRLYVTTDGYSEDKALSYIKNEYAFLVQTDKAVYFPNDLIRFRVFAVDSETMSVNPSRITDLIIRGAGGNVVATFKNIKFLKGKFESEYQLSSGLRSGLWKFEVKSGDDISTKFIEIAEYSVPIVYADVKIPPKVPFSFGIVPITVTATYSYPDEVVGTATVIFERFGTEYFRRKIGIIDSIANFDVNLVQDLKASSQEVFSYDVRLEFFDELTGTTVNSSTSFEVVPAASKIFLSGDAYLVPGKPFNYAVTVQRFDGSPAPAGTQVSVLINPEESPSILMLNNNGFASGIYSVPVDVTEINIVAISSDASPVSLNVTLPLPAASTNQTSDVRMRLDVITKEPAVNTSVEVQATLNEITNKIVCVITAKGVLLETFEVPVSNASNQTYQTARFTFNPTFAYAPLTQVLAYYVNKNGSLITSKTSVDLSNRLKNNLTFSVPTLNIKPGATITVNIESSLQSTVSMGAVDQRILTLRGGNSITRPDIFDDLLKFYGTSPYDKEEMIKNYEINFKLHGLIIFSNIPANLECSQLHNYTRPILKDQPVPVVPLAEPRRFKTPSKFENSILWKNVDIKQSIPNDKNRRGRETVTEIATNGLTSYVMYGVSMSTFDGLGVPDVFPSFNIFRPFFISVEVPFSVKRTELLVLSITIFNFLTQSQTFDVKIRKNSKFVMDPDSNFNWIDSGDFYIRTVTSEVRVHSRIKFALKAQVVGTANINIAAAGPLAGDSVDRVLRIEQIVIESSSTNGTLIIVENNKQVTKTISCAIPNTVTERINASATISGDIMGRQIGSIGTDKITKLPGGCGEQNIRKLVPNVMVWTYLKATNQLTQSVMLSLRSKILGGYQQQLKYLRNDGGFSVWGNKYPGSVWLTAYSGWAFYLSKDFITVDMSVIRRGLEFIVKRQRSDGSFYESAPLKAHKDMQGGSGNGIAMTAYIANYIFTILPDFPQYASAHQKVISHLEQNWWRYSNTYELAIIAYALKLSGSPKADNVINFFYMKRTETDTTISYKNIETTAYCLLILLVRGEKQQDAMKISNYLVSVSNKFGGFFYSQDTVMAIYALSKFGLQYSIQGSVNLTLTPNVGPQIFKSIEYNNSLQLVEIQLNKNAQSLQVTAKSSNNGFAVIGIECNYHDASPTFVPAFRIIHMYTSTCRNAITMAVAVNFVPIGNETGMAVMIFSLPSGFIFNEVIDSPDVRLTEVENDGSLVNLYFDSIGNNQIRVYINALRTSNVTGTMGGHIRVVDYYTPTNEAIGTYVLPELTNTCGIVARK